MEVKNLHPLEIRVLNAVEKDLPISIESLKNKLSDLNESHILQAFSWLEMKKLLIKKSQTTTTRYEITDVGKQWRENHPVKKVKQSIDKSPKSIKELILELNSNQSEIGSAIGALKKAGLIVQEADKLKASSKKGLPEDVIIQIELLQKDSLEETSLKEAEILAIKKISKKRSDDLPFRITEKTLSIYSLTNEGKAAKDEIAKIGLSGNEIGEITSELLESGEWKNKRLREYDLNAPTSKLLLGRSNPYASFISWVKDKLVSMGFEEFDGPLTENEFWNGDALFMPQFHSARDIHDVYYIQSPSISDPIEKKYLDNVSKVHTDGGNTGSRGWKYQFDKNFTRRMLLRSQGTVLSAHQLTKAKIPGKYFGVVRCFRYDKVDATHGADFYQTEGILLGENANLKTLMGLLEMFAKEIAGASEVKYVPGYFPFTEPSIEVHIKHPILGWFELGGSGIFRPEVTKPFGIECPVLAWGMGIDRMALMKLGLKDIRELFSYELEKVRDRRG